MNHLLGKESIWSPSGSLAQVEQGGTDCAELCSAPSLPQPTLALVLTSRTARKGRIHTDIVPIFVAFPAESCLLPDCLRVAWFKLFSILTATVSTGKWVQSRDPPLNVSRGH